MGFYAEAHLPGSAAPALRGLFGGPFPWGGEGRHAVAHVLDRPVDWPRAGGMDGQPLWLLAAPALCSGSGGPWPDRIAEGELVAVAADPALADSGWDVARDRPRPARFAAPAGSVYFVTTPDPVGHEAVLCGDPEGQEGWGFALRGAWHHAR